MKNLHSMDTNTIVKGDCIAGMKDMPEESVDIIIADPPYNLSKNFGEWNENNKKDIWLTMVFNGQTSLNTSVLVCLTKIHKL